MEQPAEVAAQAPRIWDRPAATVPALAVLALVGGQLPAFSVAASGYILIIGAALMWLGLSHRARRSPGPSGSRSPGSGSSGSSSPGSSSPGSARLSAARLSSARRGSARPGAGAWWWLAPVVALVGFEVWTLRWGARLGYPTLSDLADPMLADPVWRSVAYLGWLAGFWALVRR